MKEEDYSTIYYTELGKEDRKDNEGNPITDSSDKALAKAVYRKQLNYYIRVGNDGKIYNPHGLFSEGSHNNFLKRLGKPQWKMLKVPHKVFSMYLNFLRTKNTAWLNNAQRELH